MASQVPLQQSGFPVPNAPAVDSQGFLSPIWLYFLQLLWRRSGAQFSFPTQEEGMVYGTQTSAKRVTFYNVTTGAPIGYVDLT